MVKLVLIIFLSFSSSLVFSDTNKEIGHLLDFVGKTACQYQRNGNDHNGQEARLHIQKKYDYYRDDIESAEGFIVYSATKSTMSGKKYTIACKNEAVQFSDEWLNNELKKYRAQSLAK